VKQNGGRSNDKISKVVSRFASIQSNSVDLEGSCQSVVYRSKLWHIKNYHKCQVFWKELELRP